MLTGISTFELLGIYVYYNSTIHYFLKRNWCSGEGPGPYRREEKGSLGGEMWNGERKETVTSWRWPAISIFHLLTLSRFKRWRQRHGTKHPKLSKLKVVRSQSVSTVWWSTNWYCTQTLQRLVTERCSYCPHLSAPKCILCLEHVFL